MARVIKTESIEALGMGRPDYTEDVEIQPIPVVRGYQEPARYEYEFDNIPASGEVEHTTDEFDYAHFIFDVMLSATANVLLEMEIYAMPENVIIFSGMGYQKIARRITGSFPADQIKIIVRNKGDADVSAIYWHSGVKGVEKIETIRRTL